MGGGEVGRAWEVRESLGTVHERTYLEAQMPTGKNQLSVFGCVPLKLAESLVQVRVSRKVLLW